MLVRRPAPELGSTIWYNSPPLRIEGLRGKVVVMFFWSSSSIDCIRALPQLRGLWSRYKEYPFILLGVHVPEYDFEEDRIYLGQAIERYGLLNPNVMDGTLSISEAFENSKRPSLYFIDKEGIIRYAHIGGGWEMEAEAWVVRLLREVGVNLALKEVEELPQTYDDRTTEEIFCGVLKNKGIGNDMECEAFIVCSYRDAGDHDLGTIYLDGLWSQEMQYLQHSDRDPGRITVRFQACEAYVVLSTDESIEPEVLLDGAPLVPENAGKDIIFRDGRSVIRVDRNGLFNLFHSDRFEVHELSVITVSDRLMVYSFSFH